MKEIKNIYDNGFVKLSKQVLEWQWYSDPNVARLYFHILLKANFKENNWRGIEIKIGEFVTSIDKLHVELNISIQTIRTALKKLERTGYIERRPTNQFTLIKLLDSDVFTKEFFISNKQVNNPKTIHKHSSNNQKTTTNKEKKELETLERKEVFKKQIFQFQNQFSKEKLDSFFNYWSEECEQTGRLKFEDEKFWNLETRISNWKVFGSESTKKKSNNFYLNR
ncbi:GntR family transcriptional regulator [Flavobacterium sp. UBA7663]|uniref:GntR family transcriptional regulator n=1 Tax=Flavobacterium sp. UBA7663 TaxID=1946557 RepID=UPI0025BB16C9|nr:GntR family transcriptional regulator [Flavobacterium sp. UBA7663]